MTSTTTPAEESMSSRLRADPAVRSIAVVIAVGVAWMTVRGLTTAGAQTDAAFVGSGGFRAWTGLAAVALVAFVIVLVSGVSSLQDAHVHGRSPTTARHVALFMVFLIAVVAVLLGVGGGGPDVPVELWVPTRALLLLLGAAAVGPWVVLLWACHSCLRRVRSEIPDLPGPGTSPATMTKLDDELTLLLRVREDIAAAVGHLLVPVVLALLLAGALREALVSTAQVSESDFPRSAVLLYGAFFTAVLVVAAFPLLLDWRRTATLLLHHAYPRRVSADAQVAAGREQLRSAMDLDGSLFRSPVALGTLTTPLVTSLLAVAVPAFAA